MKVIPILTTPPKTSERVTRLVLETIKIGFPTAEIDIYDNQDLIPHFEVIEQLISDNRNRPDPLIILDGDVIFWDNVEPWINDWEDRAETSLAGYFVPTHMNPFSQSRYISRLHTSFLVMKPQEVDSTNYRHRHPPGFTGPYKTAELIKPYYVHEDGIPTYYDTCAGLYHVIGGEHFSQDILDCYDHVNSASFYHELISYLTHDEREEFKQLHQLAENEPEKLRGLYKTIDAFYKDRIIP